MQAQRRITEMRSRMLVVGVTAVLVLCAAAGSALADVPPEPKASVGAAIASLLVLLAIGVALGLWLRSRRAKRRSED